MLGPVGGWPHEPILIPGQLRRSSCMGESAVVGGVLLVTASPQPSAGTAVPAPALGRRGRDLTVSSPNETRLEPSNASPHPSAHRLGWSGHGRDRKGMTMIGVFVIKQYERAV